MTELRTVLTDLAIGESPRWHDGRLWFSNWGTREIVAVDEVGHADVILTLPFAGFPFSIDWLPDGRLLIASSSEEPLVRREPDGALVPHAAIDGGLNEIVVDRHGRAYVNGAGFDPMAGEAFAPGRITLVAPDGKTRQVASGIAFPNGMAITPDERTLIAADSYGRKLLAFSIEDDGGLGAERVWANLGDGVPDGICIDADGAVWYADVPNRRCVRVREGGQILDTIEVDRGCFACMLGGADGRTLFILAAEWHGFDQMIDAPRTGRLLAVRVDTPAAGRP